MPDTQDEVTDAELARLEQYINQGYGTTPSTIRRIIARLRRAEASAPTIPSSAPAEADVSEDGRTDRDRRHIGIGMAIAAGIVMSVWGDETHASEILGAAGYNSAADLRRDGVEDYDIKLLKPVLKARAARLKDRRAAHGGQHE